MRGYRALPTCKYRELSSVCRELGLEGKNKKNEYLYFGISPLNNELISIIIHEHATGRDIPDGLFMN